MPCPASYEEQRLVALDGESARLARSVEAQFSEIPDTLQLVNAFAHAVATAAVHDRLQELGLELQQLLDQEGTVGYAFTGFTADWPTMEVVQQYEAFVDGLRRIHYALESTLCEARMLLYANAQALQVSFTTVDTAWQAIWTREMGRHAKHRETDREAVLLPMEHSLEYYQGRLLENLSPTQRESAEAYVKEFSEKIDAVKRIPIESMMAAPCGI